MMAYLQARVRARPPLRRSTALLLLVVALLAASCTSSPSGPTVRQGGTLYVALDAEPQSLDPLIANDATSRRAYQSRRTAKNDACTSG